MTKPTKWFVRPAKTQISLGIRPVWSESSLSAWRKLGSLATHWAHRAKTLIRLATLSFCWFCLEAAQYIGIPGHDTTASAISWILYALATHPECQRKCQEEIDSILQGRTTVEWWVIKIRETLTCLKHKSPRYVYKPPRYVYKPPRYVYKPLRYVL